MHVSMLNLNKLPQHNLSPISLATLTVFFTHRDNQTFHSKRTDLLATSTPKTPLFNSNSFPQNPPPQLNLNLKFI